MILSALAILSVYNPLYTIKDIGSLTGAGLGGSYTRATAINDAGMVAGDSWVSSAMPRPFRYTPNGQMTNLGVPTGAVQTEALHIAADGTVVGNCVVRNSSGEEGWRVFIARPNQPITVIEPQGRSGSYPFVLANTLVYGVNENLVVVGTTTTNLSTGEYLFKWTPATGLQLIDTSVNGFPIAVDRQGRVLAETFDGRRRIFLYDPVLGRSELPVPSNFKCAAMNNSGVIAGVLNPGTSNPTLATWSIESGLRDHGRMAGFFHTIIGGINDNGSIYGSVRPANGASWDSGRAFLYTPNEGFRDLNDLIPQGTSWVLRHAAGMNSAGQLTGWGLLSGWTRSFIIEPADQTAPTVQISVSPESNSSGWHRTDVTVQLQALDDSGAAFLRYRVNGGEWNSSTGPSASIELSPEGTHSIEYAAVDQAGNTSELKSIQIRIDKTAPTAAHDPAPTDWRSENVQIIATVTDSGSGPANGTSLLLTTTVPDGEENANASTNHHIAYDLAGNATSVGPLSGLRIDRRAPTISVSTPVNESVYIVQAEVYANFLATDRGSGIGALLSTAQSGSLINTSAVGWNEFKITATDNVGWTSTSITQYAVTYGVLQVAGNEKPKRAPYVTLRAQLTNAQGVNISRGGVMLTPTRIGASGSVIAAPGQTPAFTFDSATQTYSFRLDVRSLASGEYELEFMATGDPIPHHLHFSVS